MHPGTAAQARAGIVPYANLLSIQTQLAITQATLPPLRQQLAHTIHLLATGELSSRHRQLSAGANR